MQHCSFCGEIYSPIADARGCPESREAPFRHEWVEVTDVCDECGVSGRAIARAGHLIGCSKNPNTRWPEVKPYAPQEDLTIAEELIPAPPMPERVVPPIYQWTTPPITMAEVEQRLAEPDRDWTWIDHQIPEGRDAQEFIAEAIAEATGQEPPGPKPILPTDSMERKNTPICTGVFDYFPRALAYISKVSKAGNDKHNPGQPLHWSKDKSTDHADCIARHLIERGTRDLEDGLRHSGKLGWRALANLEIELENAEKKGESW